MKNLDSEIVEMVLHYIIDNGGEVYLTELLDNLDIKRVQAVSILNLLSDVNIIKKEALKDDKANYFYTVKTNIKAVDIARAFQVGINLKSFEKDLKISDKEKKLANELSLKVEELKNDDSKKKPLVKVGRDYLSLPLADEIVENLYLILEAANSSLYEYLQEQSEKDEHLKRLMELHLQAETTLKSYIESNKRI
jgi:hypothetical protein